MRPKNNNNNKKNSAKKKKQQKHKKLTNWYKESPGKPHHVNYGRSLESRDAFINGNYILYLIDNFCLILI